MEESVIVVGAGFSGLSAAVALAGRGIPVHVLEKRRLPGGRASCVSDPKTGELLDVGPHVYFGCYRAARRFLSAIDAADRVGFQERPEIHLRDLDVGETHVLRLPKLPAPFHLLAGLVRLKRMTFRDRISLFGLVPAMLSNKGELAERRDAYSGADWLRGLRQTPALERVLWRPFCRAATNLPLETASAALLKVAVDRCLFGTTGAAAVGVPVSPAVSVLSPAVEDYVSSRGGEVRYRAAVRRIVIENGKACGVELVSGEPVTARSVVCAVPHGALSRLLGGSHPSLCDVLRRVEGLSASPILTVHLWLDRPVMEAPFMALVGSRFDWLFDRGQGSPIEGRESRRVSLLMGSAGASEIGAGDRAAELAAKELRRALAPAAAAKVLHWRVILSPFATPALGPGTNRLRPGVRTAVKGLYLAGDYTDTGLPATLESACVSGFRAADAAAEDLGAPPVPAVR